MYIGTAMGRVNSPYVAYSSTDKLLAALNYDTTGMTISEDFSVFNNLKVNGIDGSGTVTLSYLKSHVVKKDSTYITPGDLGRTISVSFLEYENMEAEIIHHPSGQENLAAAYNVDMSSFNITGYPAYMYVYMGGVEQFQVVFEQPIEEEQFNVSASFVDSGEEIFKASAVYMSTQPGVGAIYLVSLPAFNITSTLDPSDNETFNFSNITYWNEHSPYVILGNAGAIAENLPSNSDTLYVAIGMIGSGAGNGAMGCFLSANPPYSEDFALPEDAMESGIDYWLGSIWDKTGLDEFDIYTALLSDITINEAYVIKSKLDSKYIDIPDFSLHSNEPIYINEDDNNSINLFYGEGLTTKNSYNSDVGHSMNQLVLSNASTTTQVA